MSKKILNQSGQAMITILVCIAFLAIIVFFTVASTIVNTRAASKAAIAEETFHLAEGSIENATLKLVRDPSYTGESYTQGNALITITITGAPTSSRAIYVKTVNGNNTRNFQADGAFANNKFMISSWKEVD